MEGGERGQRTRELKEVRKEKGEGEGGGSRQRQGVGNRNCTRGDWGNCVVRREMGNVKQEGGEK